MEANSQLLSFKSLLKVWYLRDLGYFMQRNLMTCVLRWIQLYARPPLNTSPKPRLQKVLPCKYPCCTWDLGLGAPFIALVTHTLFILLLAANLIQSIAPQSSTVQMHVIKRYACHTHTM
jgi:hypothetical protein